MEGTRFEHYFFETIDSTNDWAKANINCLDMKKITIIRAAEQTAGHGRFNRTWQSPPHCNLYATICFSLPSTASYIKNISQLLAISVVQVLKKFHFEVKLKWPNDLFLSKRKFGGILCETIPKNQERMIILGLGVNVNMPLDLLQKIDQPATSLFHESKKTFEVETLLNEFVLQFVVDFEQLQKYGFGLLSPFYKKSLLYGRGEKIRVSRGKSEMEGYFQEITLDGSLVLQAEDGTLHELN